MENKYETTNFYLSAWLLSRGLLPKLEYKNPNSNKATFVFESDSNLETHIQEFHQDDVTQEFIQSIKKLKDILYKDREPQIFN